MVYENVNMITGVFQRYHGEKYLSEFYPHDGGESQVASKLRHCLTLLELYKKSYASSVRSVVKCLISFERVRSCLGNSISSSKARMRTKHRNGDVKVVHWLHCWTVFASTTLVTSPYIYVYFTTKVVQKSLKNKKNKSDMTRARGMYKYIQS